MNNFWEIWYEEENKEFDSLVNGDNKFNHKKAVKQMFANNKKITTIAIVSKFANDKWESLKF